MRTAIIHYWLLNMRGGEKVIEALCRMYPDADIFTLFYDPSKVSETIRSHKVTASFLDPMRGHYRSMLPLMPLALEQFDLRGYDLVISSESGPAKGVLASAGARHVCYCHSPMRYLWELYPTYLRDWSSAWKRPFIATAAHYLRLWDYASAARVDAFAANSSNVKRRIQRSYRRDAEVVYPPVALERFSHQPSDDYFLIVSELAAYKRIDAAVAHCTETGQKLKIAGGGPEYAALKQMAGSSVEFCGHVPDSQLADLFGRCRAFLIPAEEDFGITCVEALASGKPVIALNRGGSVEILGASPGIDCGVLYSEQEGISAGITRFEKQEKGFVPESLQRASQRFSEDEFRNGMLRVINAQ